MIVDEIIVYCENCGKPIYEKLANWLFKKNSLNYLILCEKCYDRLKELKKDDK